MSYIAEFGHFGLCGMAICKVRKVVDHAPLREHMAAHLRLLGLEPIGGEPLMSVTCGQRNARPTVTFPAARHHHPLAGTKLYCSVTEVKGS